MGVDVGTGMSAACSALTGACDCLLIEAHSQDVCVVLHGMRVPDATPPPHCHAPSPCRPQAGATVDSDEEDLSQMDAKGKGLTR